MVRVDSFPPSVQMEDICCMRFTVGAVGISLVGEENVFRFLIAHDYHGIEDQGLT